jgi:hypothetical protein
MKPNDFFNVLTERKIEIIFNQVKILKSIL